MVLSRRSFLRRLVALPFAGRALQAAIAAESPEHDLLNRFHVAGFQYYHGPDLVCRMRAGEALRLTPEPKNPHDRFAVMISFRGRQIGYVPRSDNRHISRLLRQGVTVRGRIAEVRPGEPTWKMVWAEVFLERRAGSVHPGVLFSAHSPP